MANRVQASIERRKVLIDKRLADGLTTAEKLEETRKAMDLAFDEYCAFNTIKSLAHAMGKISLEEALSIYEWLGEAGPDNFNAAPIHVKAALTQWYDELLAWKIRGAPAPSQPAE